jgi:hypothetical protein
MSQPPFLRSGAPAPLAAAAGLVLVEGVLTIVYGLSELLHLHAARAVMGLSTALFFAAYGGALLVCAWGMHALRSWSRGPVLFAQLVWLGLAWNFRNGETRPVAVGLAVLAVLVLLGIFHPRSVDVLNREEHRAD